MKVLLKLLEAIQLFELIFVSNRKAYIWRSAKRIPLPGRNRNGFPLLLGVCMCVDKHGSEISMAKPLRKERQVHAILIQMHGPAVPPEMAMRIVRNVRTNPTGHCTVLF